jgi:phosphate uptake regulator
MEQRKLIQHGLSSLTVSLPIKWLKDRALNKGDPIFIDTQGNKLVLSTKEPLQIEKASVDVTKLDRTSILYHIQSLYRFGYNEIEVTFNKQTAMHYRLDKEVGVSSVIHYIVNRLIGAEIVEQGNNRILIKYITKEYDEDFKVVLRRVFFLLEETAGSLLAGIRNMDYNAVAATDDKHDNIAKFISYALRLLNKYGYPDVKKTCFYYHIIASLDKIVDIMKYNARNILKNKKKFKRETLEIWKNVNDSIKIYHQLFYNFSLEKVEELSKNRDRTKNLIMQKMDSIPKDELAYLTGMKQVLEIILDLTDFRMGLMD